MSDTEYIIFCDESDKDGQFFSNFYGGVLVGSSQYERITRRLNLLKEELHLFGEVKWQKVTSVYLEKYEALIYAFFEELRDGHLKVRIMFQANSRLAASLTKEQAENEYFILYYQFLKYAFGFGFAPRKSEGTLLRLYLDKMPDTKEKIERFKGFILGLNKSTDFRKANLSVKKEDITEVCSHDHVLLQCLDIVLGAMTFRLNDKHKVKPEGARVRGKKTRAKEKLYRVINREICGLYPGFNIGISTGTQRTEDRWRHPYRHWCFQANNAQFDPARTKKKNPT